ncbi:MAG: hypothetical protein ACPGHX_03550 [Candidatus Puniceispirillaceae bacterium]
MADRPSAISFPVFEIICRSGHFTSYMPGYPAVPCAFGDMAYTSLPGR